jgi:hypothetical protein
MMNEITAIYVIIDDLLKAMGIVRIVVASSVDIFKNKKIGSVHLFPALKGCV